MSHPSQSVRPLSTPVPAAPARWPWPWIVVALVVLAGGAWFLFHGGAAPQKLMGTIIGSSGSFEDKGNDIGKVFDGNVSTFFDGSAGNGQWMGLSLGSEGAARIVRIRFYPRDGMERRMVGGVFQVSSDRDFRSGVKDLYRITTQPPPGWNSVEVDSGDAYRYVRYLAPKDSYGNVAEIEFYGVKE